ncbi:MULTISPECIES: ribosome biogenesis GTP-binding protein YihA/YsxC [unclassified Nitratiruptor]|uniref:ribosome biogenesis GTP-binding protein YihA/YsxC n=1 Tax=unclassified Nitratiruptor TaxID=2624044 RepID=UPI00191674C3|nr:MULTISPECIES: ribosome biogenesis GTP-binding protein YihA/YsxC [unclassified Nitratiruptor]BCD60498.1 GTP-binding protein EngB [Nitratiruptor sp. YY08-10]BCD64013.1 GTP-binding protein EngB [Nitratiruptor sp. YY08-14]
MIRPVASKFVTSAPTIKQAPPASMSEVAFLGRSNVGKSSLLNALTDRKNLAKSSATPGKTKLINFFDVEYKIDEQRFPLRFVDLPGYGYAKASKSLKNEWQKHLTQFLANRDAIRVFVHLIDARHPSMSIDDQTRAFLQSIKKKDQIVIEVFTKADKLKQKELAALKKRYPDALLISNVTKKGIEELKRKILEHIFGKDSLL